MNAISMGLSEHLNERRGNNMGGEITRLCFGWKVYRGGIAFVMKIMVQDEILFFGKLVGKMDVLVYASGEFIRFRMFFKPMSRFVFLLHRTVINFQRFCAVS